MKHVIALIVKLIMVTVFLAIILNFFNENVTFADIVIYSLAVTILAYLIGDLLVLSISNNTIATIADIGLAIVTLYLVDYLWTRDNLSFTSVLISAIAIGIGEWFFHKYLVYNVFPDYSKEDSR